MTIEPSFYGKAHLSPNDGLGNTILELSLSINQGLSVILNIVYFEHEPPWTFLAPVPSLTHFLLFMTPCKDFLF